MKQKAPHIVFPLFLLVFCTVSFAQDVSVRATVDRNKILIGERIRLQLEATTPANMQASWFPADSLHHFEVIEKGKVDTLTAGDNKTYRQTLVITSFDSGRWSIPSLPLQSGNKEYLTDSIPVSVAYVNADPKQDYHDIKDILEVPNPNTGYINWVLAGLSLLSLLAIVYFLRKKVSVAHQPEVKKVISKLPPLAEALQSLEALEKKGWANGEVKSFYTQLNDIFRWYLFRRANLHTMEQTTGELMMQLRQFNLPGESFTRLVQTLRVGDAVKFAKYKPEAAENASSLATVKESLGELDKIISS